MPKFTDSTGKRHGGHKDISQYRRLHRVLKAHGFLREQTIVAVQLYRVDFMHPARKLIVEFDGVNHRNQIDRDARRDRNLKKHGWKVLRVSSTNVDLRVVYNWLNRGVAHTYTDADEI